jgi:hypothetical protein
MTEAEWLAATDPQPMLVFLRIRGKASPRKLRLFAYACCRRVWHLMTDRRSRGAVEALGEFADGLARWEDMNAAQEAAIRARDESAWPACPNAAAAAACACGGVAPDDSVSRALAADAAGRAAGDAAHNAALARGWEAAVAENLGAAERWARTAEAKAQANLLRCLFPYPFRPPPILSPAVLAWDGGTVPKLAQAIYEERAFDRLPVLADALEDAGCTDAGILGHCRSGGEHVRGCWVVDLVLGKG